jgi:hypothetical protein
MLEGKTSDTPEILLTSNKFQYRNISLGEVDDVTDYKYLRYGCDDEVCIYSIK